MKNEVSVKQDKMGGKSMKAMRDTMDDNENFNAAKVTSAVSILPGQSGGPRENRDGGVSVTDPAVMDLQEGNARFETLESSSNDKQALFQDMLRSKLISDFSSGIFHSNPETEIDKKDMTQIIIERLSVIEQILVQIFLLSDPGKLFLYQKFPNSQNNSADTLPLPLNLLGNQQEIQQAIFWIKTHLGEMYEKCALEQDIYDQYIEYCRNASVKALSTSDFGKVMKQVFAEIRARRLGTRSKSHYCYSGMRNSVRLPTTHLPKSVHKSDVDMSSTKNDSGAMSTEIKEERNENHKKKLKTPNKSPKISSATAVKDSAPDDSRLLDVENSTMENKVATHSATKLNFANDMNTDSENKDNLSQPLLRLPTTNTDDINCALGKDLNIFSDNVAEVIKNDCTNNKIIVNFLDKVQLNNEELNVKGADEVDKSNEVDPSQNVKSAESQPNTFLPTRIPLRVFKRTIQIASFKKMSGQRTLRIQGRRSSKRSQRFRGRRPQPQSQRCRRRRFSIRLEPVDCGTYWLNIESLLKNKRNEVADLTRVIEERVKYFGHLEDTKVLGVVGETVVKELLKLNLETIAEIIFSGLESIRGARNQSCLQNTSGAHTPAEVAAQGGLPQRSQNSEEYSAEPTVTFQKQGDIKYVSNHHLLISNTENMENVNTVDVNRQNNTFVATRPENSSVSSSTNYLRFVHISPDSETPLLTPETSPFFSHQTAQTMLNNNVLPPNYCSRPDGHFLPLNHGFLLSNNVLPPNNNLISSDNTFLPENNIDLNGFDNINPSILNGALDVQNNIMAEGTFPQTTPDFAPENYSANFYRPNAPENFYEISNFHEYFPDEANFNQASMETDFVFPNVTEEIDQLLVNQHLFEDPLASIVSSQLEPVNNMTGGEFWFPNNYNCNDTNNTLDEYSNEQTNLYDSNEHSFEPISDCQTTGSVMESEPLPMLSLDDLAMDNDDITDQIFSHNYVSDSNNFNFDNNSSDILPGQIDETLNQTDSLLEFQAGDNDFFDDFFDNSAKNSKGPPGEGTMNECTSYVESSALDNFSYGVDINDQLNEYLGLN